MWDALTTADVFALGIFIASWLALELVLGYSPLAKFSLSGLMAAQRRQWILVLADREMRMVDTQIMAGLQQGCAFFASTSMIGIGGCFALLGSTETALQIYRDLPLDEFSRTAWEIKSLGLALILAYSFFKFGWAYRLFNYCGVLLGAVPEPIVDNREQRITAALRLAHMNILAGRHFTAGMRGLFFSMGYLGWFISPEMLVFTTLAVALVLVRRQYFSNARRTLLEDPSTAPQ